MTSLAVSGNWSVFHSFRDFFLVSRKSWLFEFLIVYGVVKLSVCFFNVDISIPYNYTSVVSWFDNDVICLLKISQSAGFLRCKVGTFGWLKLEVN